MSGPSVNRSFSIAASVAIVLLVMGFSVASWAGDRDGDKIADAVDACPDTAEDYDGVSDSDGCPEDGDRDGDGISDSDDLCPTVAEDKDGDTDTDGCPDVHDDKDEDGIADADDLCGYEPEDHDGFQDDDGCPDPDNDGDKIADSYDACPLSAEDGDGFEDSDGCPELDNDGDGFPDLDDSCPDAAEDMDGHEDEDGCPDLLVVLTKSHIEITDKVYFVFDSDEIEEVSFPLLNDVAQVIVDHPELRVRVEGHTDAKGSDAYNLELSTRRASSVRSYLITRGVAEDRLESEGYGETRPLGSDDIANRRVEFVIVD